MGRFTCFVWEDGNTCTSGSIILVQTISPSMGSPLHRARGRATTATYLRPFLDSAADVGSQDIKVDVSGG